MEKTKIASELKDIFSLVLASINPRSLFKMILAKTPNWDAVVKEFIDKDNRKNKDKYQIELDFKKKPEGDEERSYNSRSVKDMVSGKVKSSFRDASQPQQEEIEQWVMLALFMPDSLETKGRKVNRSEDATIEDYLIEETKEQKYNTEEDILTRFRKVVEKSPEKSHNFVGYLYKMIGNQLGRLKQHQSYKMQLLMEDTGVPDSKIVNNEKEVKNLKNMIEDADKKGDSKTKEKLEKKLEGLEKTIQKQYKIRKKRDDVDERATEVSDSDGPYGVVLDVDGIADVYEEIDSKKYDFLRKDIEKYVKDKVLTYMSTQDKVTDREKEKADVAIRLVKLRLENPDLSIKDLGEKLDEDPSDIKELLSGPLQRTMRSYASYVYDKTGNDEFKKILDRWKWVDFGKRAANARLASLLDYMGTLFEKLENNLN